jgi:predicted Zn finger-like uncharacterized protein
MQNVAGDRIFRFFVNSQNQATIRCPKCGTSKTVDASKIQFASKQLKVTCKCGETFKGEFEFRKHYRKAVKLPGRYIHLNSPKRGDIIVVDLSMTGIGFTTQTAHELKIGDKLEITFRLDNGKRSEIRVKAVVRNVKEKFAGVERTDTLICKEDLGFYLM